MLRLAKLQIEWPEMMKKGALPWTVTSEECSAGVVSERSCSSTALLIFKLQDALSVMLKHGSMNNAMAIYTSSIEKHVASGELRAIEQALLDERGTLVNELQMTQEAVSGEVVMDQFLVLVSLGDVPLARRLIDTVADKALAWRMVKKDAQANKLFSVYRQKSIVHLVFLFLQGHLIQSVPIN